MGILRGRQHWKAGQIEFIQYTSRDTGEHVFTVHQGGMTEEQMRLILAEMGVLTSITPCALSNVPLVIGYVGGTGQKDTRRAFWLSLTFSAGTAVTFTVLGVVASAAGKLMGISAGWWNILRGVCFLKRGFHAV